MRRGFIWRIALPVGVGVWLALKMFQGDTSAYQVASEFVSNISVKEEESYSFQGLKVFELRFTDGTAVTVMGSANLPVIQYLDKHPAISLEMRPRELQRIER